MAKRLWERAGRTETSFALGQRALDAALYLCGFSSLAAAMSWIANDFRLVADQGWGAVVFAGVAAACGVTLAVAAILVAVRYFRPLPAPAAPTPPAASRSPIPEAAHVDRLARGEIDGFKEAVTHQFKQVRDEIAHGLEEIRARQDDADAAIKAGIAEAKRHGENAAAGTGASLAEGLRDLRLALDGVTARLEALDKQSGTVAAMICSAMRARDDEAEMKRLDGEAAPIFGTPRAW